jgi:hypothetical protein
MKTRKPQRSLSCRLVTLSMSEENISSPKALRRG